MGTAVAALALAQDRQETVSRLILMSPFNNLLDVVVSQLEHTSSRLKYCLWAAVHKVSGMAGFSLLFFTFKTKTEIIARISHHGFRPTGHLTTEHFTP